MGAFTLFFLEEVLADCLAYFICSLFFFKKKKIYLLSALLPLYNLGHDTTIFNNVYVMYRLAWIVNIFLSFFNIFVKLLV